MAKIYVLPYYRKGLSNSITSSGQLKQHRATLKVNLGVELNKKIDDTRVEKLLEGQEIQLMGPTDVKSVQKNAISRISPPEGAKTRLFKDYLPYVEFFEEDLPWRYTPVATTDADFRPWMTLIAVKEDEVSFHVNSNGTKLATLQIGSEERYGEIFPNAKLLFNVAHVQIDSAVEVTRENVNDLLDENPDCGISRILCTSTLEENSTYVALLIPTYELGRLAGLGLSVDDVRLGKCAWENLLANQNQRPDGLTFPVYFKWKFHTSIVKADFKTLASQLFFTGEKEYDQMKAYLDVDISQSGLGDVHFDEEKVVDVPAALMLDKKNPEPRKEDNSYTEALKDLLELNPVLKENETGEINMEEDPWIVPPVYGARHLLTTQAQFANNQIDVVKEVNLQLKNRVAAGMGSTIVKKNQEQFVNRAWKKVEKINQLNQAIREYYQMKQVSEKATAKYSAKAQKSKATEKNKVLLMDVANRSLQTASIYRHQVSADNLLDASKEMIAINQQEQSVKSGITVKELSALFSTEVWEEILGDESPNWQSVKKELEKSKSYLKEQLKIDLKADESCEEENPEAINPDAIGENRVDEILAKYGYTEDYQLSANLDSKYPVMAYPDFLEPTFYYLREYSASYVVPSAASLLKDSITYFRTNPQFEEAFLMGMNTEMGQELLWREYPTDQRGSYFRKFWDQEDLPDKGQLDKYYDVKPLHQWKGCLGQNHMVGKNEMLVFVIRGELMQSYPSASVYLSKKVGGLLKKELTPCLSSWLTDEILLVGFNNLQSNALAGYYLTFEQQPLSLQFERVKGSNSISGEFAVVTPQIYAIPLKNRS